MIHYSNPLKENKISSSKNMSLKWKKNKNNVAKVSLIAIFTGPRQKHWRPTKNKLINSVSNNYKMLW